MKGYGSCKLNITSEMYSGHAGSKHMTHCLYYDITTYYEFTSLPLDVCAVKDNMYIHFKGFKFMPVLDQSSH